MLTSFKNHKSLTLLASLVCLFLVYPFFEMSRLGSMIYTLLFTTALLASVYAISYDVRYIAIGSLLAAPIMICHLSNFILNSHTIEITMRVCTTIFMTYTVVALLQRILTTPRVGIDEIYGAIGAYVLIGIIFGFIYLLVEVAMPGSFNLNGSSHDVASLVYFSFVTLTTAGFGDITAKAPFARAIVVIELVTGVSYVAVLIGRLLSASQQGPVKEKTAENLERKENEKWIAEILRQPLPLKQRPIGVVLACVMMNSVTSALMVHSHLPFFLDSWGTSLAVILGGGWLGIATAVIYNLLMAFTLWGLASWVWVFSSLLIAGATWFFMKRGWISILRPGRLTLAGVITGFLNGILVQAILYFAHMPPYEGTLPVFRFFLRATSNATFASLAEKMFVEIADKTVSFFIAAGVIFLLHDFLLSYKKRLAKKNA